MPTLGNRVKVNTTTTTTGTITLATTTANDFFTFSEAGIAGGSTVPYLIEDGADFELGTGVYDSTASTLTRNVRWSKISGTASSTGKIALSGSGVVRVPAMAEEVEQSATTAQEGRVELATDAETQTGTDTARAVTPAGAAARRVRATAQATTSGTAFDFTSIPAGVKKITVIFNEVSLSGSDSFLVQLGDSGGLETTGYVSSSTLLVGGSVSGTVSSTAGLMFYKAGTSGRIVSGIMEIVNISGDLWINSHAGKADTASTQWGGGSKALSATLDRVRITRTGADTFSAGSVNIMYEF